MEIWEVQSRNKTLKEEIEGLLYDYKQVTGLTPRVEIEIIDHHAFGQEQAEEITIVRVSTVVR